MSTEQQEVLTEAEVQQVLDLLDFIAQTAKQEPFSKLLERLAQQVPADQRGAVLREVRVNVAEAMRRSTGAEQQEISNILNDLVKKGATPNG